jgi:hypothetical protein
VWLRSTTKSRSAPNQFLPSAAKLKSFMRYFLFLSHDLRQIILRTMQYICVTLSQHPKAAL